MPTIFEKQVLKTCKKIPKGKVSTYQLIAKIIKKPKASRAVGNALNKNKHPILVPCHRVIRSDGNVGGYAKGQRKKIVLLEREGIIIKNKKIKLTKYLNKIN